MLFHCDRCGAALTPGATRCAACGRAFDAPVPGDADAPDANTTDTGVDALLRGRTASRPPDPAPAPDTAPVPAPAWYAAPPAVSLVPARPPGDTRRVRAAGGVVLAGLTLTAAALVWGGPALWLAGPGGDIAFRQHNDAGNAAEERGDFQAADAEYTQMIALRPDRVDGYLLRAIAEDKAGLYAMAIRDNTDALARARDPMTRGDLLYNRGDARLRRGDPAGAVTDLTLAYAQYAQVRDPRETGDVPAREEDTDRTRADAHWEHKDYAPAVADATAALAFGHARPDDYGIRGKAEAALGRAAAAQADFNRALRLDSTYPAAYYGLAKLAEKSHRYAQAVAVFARATRAAPESADFWGSLGWAQYQAGQVSPSIGTDRRALSLDPNQGWVLYNLGLAYAATGDAARAHAAYAVALARGTAADRRGGLGDLHDALRARPGAPALRLALAQVLRDDAAEGRTVALPPLPAPPPSPAPPADPAFAARLGPEVALGDYAVRPPAGYTLTQRQETFLDGAGTAWLWVGPRRPDGTAPDMQVRVSEDDGRMASEYTAAQEARLFLADEAGNHAPFTPSPVAACTVHGLPFARADWSGVGRRTGKDFSGLVYILVAPSQYVEISCHDAAPGNTATLPLLRAAALTFRRG